MPPRSRLRLVVAASLVTIVTLASSCGDSTGPSRTSFEAAGLYVLVEVTGRGPSSGTFLLSADGRAERRVRYPSSSGGGEWIAVGRYVLEPAGIAFELREKGGTSENLWPVRGEWRGSRFSIRYPDPADGEIVETYRRL